MDWVNQSRQLWLPLQRWVVVILIGLSAIYSAQLTWLLLQPAPTVTAPRIQPANLNSRAGSTNPEQMGATLGERQLFGQFEAVATVEPEKPVEAPETRLNMTLQAVLARGNDGSGFAIISRGGSQSSAFSIGDDIFNQATLSAVYRDRVILDRNGQLETLRYEREETSELLQVNSEPIEDDSSFRETIDQAQQRVDRGEDVQAQVEQMVSYVQQRANSDPQGLLDEVGLEATGSGYQVTQNARQLAMAGLRPGDVVTAVNDQSVGNIGQDQALLNQILQTGGELKIQIQRGSRSFTIYQSIPRF
ncbi:type II secretion system protein N [Saccharospirillum impatiens]|uniref:type II secretion system protein N n=1 Tax=Saccharospirillum impatiens TaxID=169438 RepID=UPI000429F800|nr:type II secretion system protein N [Saccharospirillum impatiens]